jgi:tetratricopeptide (TPR) repeat protein
MSDVLSQAGRLLEVRRHDITYPSADAAFEQGDYYYAATHAGTDDRLKGAALIMMGHYEGGLPLLERDEGVRASYYRAVALWGYGEDREALSWIRRGIEAGRGDAELDRRLHELRAIIEGGPIRVLVQARNAAPPSSFGIVSAMKRAPGFDVLSVGMQDTDDIRIDPYVDLTSVLASLPSGWAPHFFHVYQVDSNLTPAGLERAPFPVIGYVSDYDTRVHTCYYRARACDAMIVAGGIDHYEVSRGFGLPTAVFPKVVGVHASAFAERDPSRKDRDLFCSGTAMTFYQNDKGALIYRLTQLDPRFRIHIQQGFLDSASYVEAVTGARTVFTFVRRQPVWSSRALEALAGGAVALYQKNAGLDLFFTESEGAVPYDEADLESVVTRVLDRWDSTYGPAALRGRARVLKEFDLAVCMERYLKRMALLSAEIARRPRHAKSVPLETTLRYPPTARGSFVASKSAKKRAWCHGFARTAHLLRSTPSAQRGPNSENLLAFCLFMMGHRDSDFDRLVWKWNPHSNTYLYFAKAVEALEDGVRRFPDDLLLRFNLGRLCYHTGRVERAYEAFGGVVAATSARVNPLLELYGEDFGELNLAFRDYVDELWRYLVSRDVRGLDRLTDPVIASAWHYRGLIELKRGESSQALKSLERAIRRHGHNACYHEQYANLLWSLGTRHPKARRLALRHLEEAWEISPYCSGLMAKLINWLFRCGEPASARRLLARYDALQGRVGGMVASLAERRALAKVRAVRRDPALVES